MKKFKIEVQEILQRVVEVEAETFDEALKIVNEKYSNEEIVLGSEDYIETDIRGVNSLDD